jgi:catechol 2,3-dioxygenase-like lactoylglutathione lyase family enzyme
VTVQEVVVVSVPVADQDRAKDFYVNKLGFELLREDESVPGMRWIQVAPKGAGTALTLVTWFDTMPAGSLQGLVVRSDDIHRDYQEMSARGVRFDGPPQVQAWGTETVLIDPDGNRIVMQQA